jgi:hypothetical protein
MAASRLQDCRCAHVDMCETPNITICDALPPRTTAEPQVGDPQGVVGVVFPAQYVLAKGVDIFSSSSVQEPRFGNRQQMPSSPWDRVHGVLLQQVADRVAARLSKGSRCSCNGSSSALPASQEQQGTHGQFSSMLGMVCR